MSNCVVGSGGSWLPCSTIAEHGVEGCDHFSHDGDDDDLGFFVGGGEAFVEGFEGGTVTAKAATATIPIVFVSGNDPVKVGLVASLNRPGGNITGVHLLILGLGAKRLGLLHELMPTVNLVGLLVNPNFADALTQLRDVEDAAQSLGLKLVVQKAGTEIEIDTAFADLVRQKTGAILGMCDHIFASQRVQIAALAARYAMPAMFELREYAIAGGLMSYGPDLANGYRQGGVYAGKILKGAKPAELPVEQP